MYNWDFGVLYAYRWVLLEGLGMTVTLTVIIVIGGLLIGLVGAIGVLLPSKLSKVAVLGILEPFRCTPILVQLIWCYYALPILTGMALTPLTACILALSFYGGSFYMEIIRGGILSIDTGQSEAGAALGMTPALAMWRIILPQAMRRMLPALMNQSIIMLKDTALVSVLAVPDLVYQGELIAHTTYRPLEAYTAVGIGYFIVLYPVTLYVRSRERKFGTIR